MATTATDAKRQSTGNKVATPRVGPQASIDVDSALGKAIGARIKLTTTSPTTTIEGTIFTTCRVTNIVAIACSTSTSTSTPTNTASQPTTYQIIPMPRIQSFNIVSLASTASADISAAQPRMGKVDLKALKAREEAAVKKLKEEEARKGKGVGREAQEIFDALARTLPSRWHNTDIIINDTVIIHAPYTTSDCAAPTLTNPANLERVRRVLEHERRKLGLGVASKRPVRDDDGVSGGAAGDGAGGHGAGRGGDVGRTAEGAGAGGAGEGEGEGKREERKGG